MSCRQAVIMAGGQGSRMRRSRGDDLPKPLVPVLAVPLLLRNVQTLLRHDFDQITVTIPSDSKSLTAYCAAVLAPLVDAFGGRLTVWRETTPLGTMGAVGHLHLDPGPALVVNADNLSDLDLRQMMSRHEARTQAAPNYAMTVAVHDAPWQLPWAVVAHRDGLVTGYREKPITTACIASAYYILNLSARRLIAQDAPTPAPALVADARAAGLRVGVHPHAAQWLDVNAADVITQAERMLRAAPERFESGWLADPTLVADALIIRDNRVLLEWRSAADGSDRGCWDTPGGKLESGETAAQALGRELREELGVAVVKATRLHGFDDVDPHHGGTIRHHPFVVEVGGEPRAMEGQRLAWRPLAEVRRELQEQAQSVAQPPSVLGRTLAIAGLWPQQGAS